MASKILLTRIHIKSNFVSFCSGRKSSNGNYDLEDGEYANSRHISEIQKVVTDLVQNSLSLDEYPSVIPMPASMTTAAGAGSARRQRGSPGHSAGIK